MPLPGEAPSHRDGHDFLGAAVDGGAGAVLTARRHPVAGAPATIAVDDPAAALTALAASLRARLDEVVAITGSAGKTTTKDLLAHVLSTTRRVGRAHGSFNNEIGVPVTVVNTPDDARTLVAEIGARRPGNIAEGCRVLRPTVGVLTIVGTAHIGIFGSQDAIAATKGELAEAVGADGHVVLNADDPRVMAMRTRTDARTVTYALDADADVRAENLVFDTDLTARFTLHTPDGSADCVLPAAGPHIVSCALAAAAAAHAMDVDAETTAFALADAERSGQRMQIEFALGGWRVLNDAYNASPEAMHAAIAAARHLAGDDGRALALVGHMAELGDHATERHAAVGADLRHNGFDHVVAVGELADLLSSETVDDPVAGAQRLRELAGGFRPGDVILVKASRVVGLERAVPVLCEEDA